MKLLQPWQKADTITAIDLELLRRQGFDTLLLDMDNTVVPWHTFNISAATHSWVERAKELGFKICIISNNHKWRIQKVTAVLEVEGVWNACKPLLGGYLKALGKLKSNRRSSVLVGDQVFTDIFGANVLGIRTILVNPISRREYKWTRFMRKLETIVTGRVFNDKAEEHGK